MFHTSSARGHSGQYRVSSYEQPEETIGVIQFVSNMYIYVNEIIIYYIRNCNTNYGILHNSLYIGQILVSYFKSYYFLT